MANITPAPPANNRIGLEVHLKNFYALSA